MKSNKKQFLTLLSVFLVLIMVIGVSVFVAQNNNNGVPSAVSSILSSEASSTSSTQSVVSSESSENSLTISEPASTEETSNSVPVFFPVDYVENNIIANYLCVYDVQSDTFLYQRNINKKCYPASITKLLTALVSAEYLNPSDPITVGDEIDLIGAGSSISFLKKGFVLTFEQLMDGMMLSSGNDAAYVMAVSVGRKYLGNPDASINAALMEFVKLMNNTALSLGCTASNFTNPDGYHDWDHYTTIGDLTLICKAALDNDLIKKSVSKKTVSYTLISGQNVSWTSTNKLLSDYPYATGLKTGTTNEAGFCLAASAEYDGKKLIAIIIGAATTDSRFTDIADCFNLAFGIK